MLVLLSVSVIFCCCTVVLSLLLREHSQLASTRGNDLDQANRLFGLTKRFNATDYFLDYGFCITKSPKPFPCVRYVNQLHREYSRLWGPPAPENTGRYPRKVVDCAYHITQTHANSGPAGASFTYLIQQRDCSSHTDIKGGAIFDAFGYSEFSLAKCINVDHFNDSYTVKCFLDEQFYYGNTKAVVRAGLSTCMKLTVVLLYEHYDGLSEVLLEWSHLYPPVRRVLSDGVQYCFSTPISGGLSLHNSLVAETVPYVPSSVKWYSGVWYRKPLETPEVSLEAINATRKFGILASHATAGSNYYYHYVPASTTSTYVYNMWENTTVSLPAQRNRSHVTVPATVFLAPHALADEYAFEPMLYAANDVAIRNHIVPRVADFTMDTCLQRRYDSSLCRKLVNNVPAKQKSRHSTKPPSVVSVDGYIDERLLLRNFTCDVYHTSMSNHTRVNGTSSVRLVSRTPSRYAMRGAVRSAKHSMTPNMMYHFIGASHMRYNFDAVSEYHYGHQVLENVPRKHDALQITNLRYNFIANARHQAAYLTQLCNKLQQDMTSANYSTSSSNHTFIFQTGAWDLASPLRRLLRDPTAGQQLLGVFERIFAGTLPCGRLRHVLWLTSVPHPMCFDDNHEACEGARSYRTNSAIAAMNSFYLDGLFKIVDATQDKTKEGAARIDLSVIDAFGIIKPRLIFNEDNEVNCLNHYTCRVSFRNAVYSVGMESALLQTPGGAAVVKSILLALSIADA